MIFSDGVFRNICLKFRNRTLGNIGGVEIAAQIRKLTFGCSEYCYVFSIFIEGTSNCLIGNDKSSDIWTRKALRLTAESIVSADVAID